MPARITERNIHRDNRGRIQANHRATRALQARCQYCQQTQQAGAEFDRITQTQVQPDTYVVSDNQLDALHSFVEEYPRIEIPPLTAYANSNIIVHFETNGRTHHTQSESNTCRICTPEQTTPEQATMPESSTPPTNEQLPLPESLVCRNCGHEKEADEPNYSTFDGNTLCDSCYKTLTAQCENCGDVEYRDDMTITFGGTVYCEACADDYSYFCEGCEDRYDGDDYFTNREGRFCSECYHERFFDCEHCDGSFSTDEDNYCEDCSSDFCDRCWNDHEHNGITPEERRERAEFREPAGNTFLEGEKQGTYITHNRFVGVEIEAEQGNRTGLSKDIPNVCGISPDGSLDDTGIEVQTVPASLDKLEQLITDTCKALRDHKYRGTKHCGMHIHIDARDIRDNHQKIIQVIKTFYATEDLLYSMLPPSRWTNEPGRKNYCKRLSKTYLYKNFDKELTKEALEKSWYKEMNTSRLEERKHHKYDESRYYGLNVHSIFFRGTIELRYHSGTTSEKKILHWTEIALAMIDYAINRYDEEQIQRMFNTETSYTKFDRFVQMLNLPLETARYMQDRINKFNPDFVVKFNKGNLARKIERMNKGKKLKSYNKKKEKVRIEVEKAILHDCQGDWRTRYSCEEDFNANVDWHTRRQLANHLFNFSQMEELESEETGFAKDQELHDVRKFIDIGRRVQQQNSQEEGGDIEE